MLSRLSEVVTPAVKQLSMQLFVWGVYKLGGVMGKEGFILFSGTEDWAGDIHYIEGRLIRSWRTILLIPHRDLFTTIQ